jgi:hypothetical protein
MWLIGVAVGVGFVLGMVFGEWLGRRATSELYLTGFEGGIVEGRRQIIALRRQAETRGRRAI